MSEALTGLVRLKDRVAEACAWVLDAKSLRLHEPPQKPHGIAHEERATVRSGVPHDRRRGIGKEARGRGGAAPGAAPQGSTPRQHPGASTTPMP